MVSAFARYYIRLKVQKQFSSDDGILLFGLLSLVAAIALLMKFIDQMYIVGTSESGNLIDVSLPGDFIQEAYFFQKMVTVSLVLTWCAIVAVKFSYLFLFKRLISRLPKMVVYWWIAAIYNAVISVYGGVVYGVACPWFYTLKACKYSFNLRTEATDDLLFSAVCLGFRTPSIHRLFRKPNGPRHCGRSPQ